MGSTIPSPNNKLVLMSGVNGYIASKTAEAFLEAGFNVRGTSRFIKSTHALAAALFPYVDAGRFSVVEVPDITTPGAFDDAVKDVSIIAHMASPVSLSFTDPDPIITTARLGTLTMLNSALTSPSIMQVMIISSVAAIMDAARGPSKGHTFTSSDWNDFSPSEVIRLGKSTPGVHIYCASKVAAERAFWSFRSEHSPPWKMTSINPALVSGPPLVLPEDPSKLPETVAPVYTILSGAPIPPPLGSGHMVDIRDVARMHVFTALNPELTDGDRYICCSAFAPEQAIADVLHEAYPERSAKMDKGTAGEGYAKGFGYDEDGKIPRLDASRAEDVTGKKWIPYGQTVRDAAKEFERYL